MVNNIATFVFQFINGFFFGFRLGGNWPTTSALYLASYITMKNCAYKTEQLIVSNESSLAAVMNTLEKNFCTTDEESKVQISKN